MQFCFPRPASCDVHQTHLYLLDLQDTSAGRRPSVLALKASGNKESICTRESCRTVHSPPYMFSSFFNSTVAGLPHETAVVVWPKTSWKPTTTPVEWIWESPPPCSPPFGKQLNVYIHMKPLISSGLILRLICLPT